MGFTEVKGIETDVLLSLHNSNGEEIVSKEIKVPPYGWLQKSLIEIYNGEIENGYIKLKVMEGGGVIGYGSIIDNKTGDAIFVASQETIPTDVYLLVPVAAEKGGGYGTRWKTDLWLLNNSSTEKEIKFTYFVGYDYYKNSVKINAGEQVMIENVVGNMFPQAGESSGSLYLVSPSWEGKVLAMSKTYNKTEEGSFGQLIPALKSMDLNSAMEEVYIIPVVCNENFRTNLGITAFTEFWVWPYVEVISYEGELLGKKEYYLEWYGNLQVDLFKDLGIGCNVDGAYVRVIMKIDILSSAMTSRNAGSVYASIIDRRTGDAIFINAR